MKYTINYTHQSPTGIIQFQLDMVDKIYFGKGKSCRCGCAGEYIENTPENIPAIKQILETMEMSNESDVKAWSEHIFEIYKDEEKDLVYTVYLKY